MKLHLLLCFLADYVLAVDFTDDPYLQYRPAFPRSLPVQILLTGVVLTLTAVLFIHLLFTAQYHWPLAPVNYVLQMAGVTTLLISLIATLHVVLSATLDESQNWPYMLSYIAVNVPPLADGDDTGWSVAERATWFIMNAATSGLIQITHIQFLTLLYPSRLEARLIFCLLGPLAIVAAIVQLVPLQGSDQVDEVASAIRNVCNAALSLLFTAAVWIWGLLVNRKEAWRTDGGTAAFGAAALALALVSTALNFLYVPREEEYLWLPSLMWAVILWQSFLGWWWWVGAGSGGTYADERRRRKRRIRDEKEQKKRLRSRGRVQRNSDQEQDITSNSNEQEHDRPSAPGRAGSTVSLTTDITTGTLPRALPNVVHRWYARLRSAHQSAARAQAAERTERIRELSRAGLAVSDSGRNGWGLGSFALRRRGSHDRDQNEQHSDEGDDPNVMPPPAGQKRDQTRPRSLFWWGPLRNWRLQDSTVY